METEEVQPTTDVVDLSDIGSDDLATVEGVDIGGSKVATHKRITQRHLKRLCP